ncbi:MAG: 4'-phosphopantetheinyl transferase superfamily protein [Thermovirgaceae bacterium]|nr:4'-phosphopantetheinyl transferase superfamily protein [Thermovirgaceae bacterium]
MIRGIGIDMCCISRLGKALENPLFIERVFKAEEQEYALDRGSNPRHYASAFAAKEAFAKAGGWGIGRVGLKNVWLSRCGSGPSLGFSLSALHLLESIDASCAHVSVSHEGDFAVAVVLLEG